MVSSFFVLLSLLPPPLVGGGVTAQRRPTGRHRRVPYVDDASLQRCRAGGPVRQQAALSDAAENNNAGHNALSVTTRSSSVTDEEQLVGQLVGQLVRQLVGQQQKRGSTGHAGRSKEGPPPLPPFVKPHSATTHCQKRCPYTLSALGEVLLDTSDDVNERPPSSECRCVWVVPWD